MSLYKKPDFIVVIIFPFTFNVFKSHSKHCTPQENKNDQITVFSLHFTQRVHIFMARTMDASPSPLLTIQIDPCKPYVVVFIRINNFMYVFLRFFSSSLRSHDPFFPWNPFLSPSSLTCTTTTCRAYRIEISDSQLPAQSSSSWKKHTCTNKAI